MAFPLSDGYHVLPAGKLAAIVTWLDMTQPPQWRRDLPAGLALRHVVHPSPRAYRDWFRQVGESWLWYGRLLGGEEELGRMLAMPEWEIYRLEDSGQLAGLLELDRRNPADVEITYFGLVPSRVGAGVGKAFMSETLRMAWQPETRRVWLHTCTVDHPSALHFYQSCGFRPYQRGLEISDDPRRTGLLPEGAGPHIPLL
ncbi:MAG: GNAT family N-acetyltransferase [Bryobacterales bacterium]|nr:GNAT family N-acetyltransferase [Bryobacterales bacterium]